MKTLKYRSCGNWFTATTEQLIVFWGTDCIEDIHRAFLYKGKKILYKCGYDWKIFSE
jgi:hypothetical protein